MLFNKNMKNIQHHTMVMMTDKTRKLYTDFGLAYILNHENMFCMTLSECNIITNKLNFVQNLEK